MNQVGTGEEAKCDDAKTRDESDVHHPVRGVALASPNAALAQSTAAPKNLRVTGVTDWTVGLRWDAPKGKVPASYVVQCISNGCTMTVAGSQTAATFSSGFDYNRTYSSWVYAVSSSGAWSGASNTVTATLLPDTTPAAKPEVSSTGSGPTHVDLAWTYGDSDPSPRFDIYVNGQLWYGQVAGRSKRIVFLSPAPGIPSESGRGTRRVTGLT